ncbi:hypothetical protein FSARC_4561 [Fusarium sarcochroum]|uniref:NAD-dependent epimerase/dehydratase domain-containing protein n=1 Tax=Fusarium sarcochroum TaxID=1208366 RepID=A0A8H4XB76_9HYPO|nr:hypothetical protein FSARC_4561 [Fusarium sarcochroum]
MTSQIQFVGVFKPTKHVSSESRKLNHSHVMRHVHAKKRRLQTQRYQDELSVGMEQNLTTSEKIVPGPITQGFANGKDPFASLARPLSPVEYFLLDHYIQVIVPYSIGHCGLFDHGGDYREQMLREWVGLAVADDTFMTVAILLSTCRYILKSRPDDQAYRRMALWYKHICLQSMRLEIESKPPFVSAITVAKALALMIDEVNYGENGIAQKHLEGVLAMVQFSGGPKSLGLTGLLEKMCDRFMQVLSLTDTCARPIPTGSWVLVTGATGFLASHVTRQFLERGFRVRGTVRDVNKASWLVEGPFKSYAEDGVFELVAVPDMGADRAFDEAIKGVAAILHIAYVTNIVPDPYKVITPSINGVRSIMEAAKREPLVKRVVVTGSAINASPLTQGVDNGTIGRDSWNDAVLEAAWAPPPYGMSHTLAMYPASKLAAEKEVWRFVEENELPFTVNVVAPAGLTGEPLTKAHIEGQANWVVHGYRGNKQVMDAMSASFYADVKDVALVHVAAVLDPEVKNARIQSWGHSIHWNEILAIFRKLRPNKEFVEDYPNPQHLKISVDQSDAIGLLKKWSGQEGWTSLEESVSDNITNPYLTD